MRSGNSRARPSRAVPLKRDAFHILLVLTLGLATERGFAAPAASFPGSQVAPNEEAQAAYRAGTVAATNNDFKTAEAELEKVVRLVPQIEEGHRTLGAVLMRLGKLPQAIKELETALELKPGDISAQTDLALAYEQTGANNKAMRSESASRIPPARFLRLFLQHTLAR
jgi:Tfp pilus assembly protein PilF